MTLPQDRRSPHANQRFIELYNGGNTPIPAWGVCEIFSPGSERPEQGNYTGSDGRTMLYVRRPTTSNPCLTVVNGPCEILVGRAGRVGTMDSPMLALVADLSYPTDTDVGVHANSFQLWKDGCGYRIIGDPDAGSGTMRVVKVDNCADSLMVRAVECIKPGDMDKACQPLIWNAATRCWVDDPTANHVYICDCAKYILALPGECFRVERDGNCGTGSDACYRPSFPYGLTRRVRIDSQINPGQCGTATILKSASASCTQEDSSCTIQVCNSTKRKIACDKPEDATLHINPGECGGEPPECYGWLVPDPRCNLAKATSASEVCGNDGSMFDWTGLDVCDWDPDPKPTSFLNPAGLYACINDVLLLQWNDCECQWTLINVQPHVLEPPIQDIFCGTGECTLRATKPKSSIVVQQCVMCEETEDVTLITGTRVTVVTGIENGTGGSNVATVLTGISVSDLSGEETPSCGLAQANLGLTSTPAKVKRKSYCMFCAQEESEDDAVGANLLSVGSAGTGSTIQFEEATPATDIDFTCDPCPALEWDKTSMWVLCIGSPSAGSPGECTCVDCLEGSGTPSSTPSATGA